MSINLIENDPILLAMAKGDILWGDLLDDEKSQSQSPILLSRKDIWTTFPVKLIPLGSGEDGAERHAVMWNHSRVAEIAEIAVDWDECKTRNSLLSALKACKKWSVELSSRPDCICVIRMVFYGHRRNPNAPRVAPLTSISDIHKLFPAVTYDIGNNLYSIELHEKRTTKMSEIKGYDASQEIAGNLLQALKASIHWRVLSSVLPGEVCRIEML